MSEKLSLHSLLQQGVNNTVPDSVLEHCPESERMLCENVLMVAQTEIDILNLASTVVTVSGSSIILRCNVQGSESSVSLNQLRTIQAYSPARVRDVAVGLCSNTLTLSITIADSNTRVTASDTEIIRVVRKRRLWQ